jgi:type IV pilus assembly protein PilC
VRTPNNTSADNSAGAHRWIVVATILSPVQGPCSDLRDEFLYTLSNQIAAHKLIWLINWFNRVMSNYSYVAIDPTGVEKRGTLEVGDQSQALQRIKEMGLYPTKVLMNRGRVGNLPRPRQKRAGRRAVNISIPGFGGRVKPAILTCFTRQLATLVEAGMPLLRGLRILEEQERNLVMKKVIGQLSDGVEAGNSFTEALSARPKVFNPLYVNMVRAGEIGGALDETLNRLAEFMEKARRIKGKIKAAMFYPCAVMFVAVAIMAVLMIFVVPKFRVVFDGLMNGKPLPAFSVFIFGLSEAVKNHALTFLVGAAAVGLWFWLGLKTKWGRLVFDKFKLVMPVLGPVFQKVAISRFSRTLGTLVGSGVPILQALTIVKETAGNQIVGRVISKVHEHVKEGDAIAPTLKSSGVFPGMVAGMVDVGEQTGALPEMLMKIADNYDEEVDNAASAMTSLLEPIMIVFLAIVVGSIVIAMFLPITVIMYDGFDQNGKGSGDG